MTYGYYTPYDWDEELAYTQDADQDDSCDPNWVLCSCGASWYGMSLFLTHAALCEPEMPEIVETTLAALDLLDQLAINPNMEAA